MSSRVENGFLFVVATALTLIADCLQAQPAPQRLPWQTHNRMVYVKTEASEVYIDVPGRWDLGSPSISPDGATIAFDALTLGEAPVRETWVVGADGGGLRKVADGAVPRWSPDGKRLLLTRNAPVPGDPSATQTLHSFALATGKERMIANGRFGDWSPDGKRIAFARGGQRTANSGVYPKSSLCVAEANGSNEKELGDGDWPSWSPDGNTIACCLAEPGRPQCLWLVDVETGKREPLTAGFYRAQWAGDGKSVVSNGYLLGPDGKPARQPARFWLDKSRVEFFAMDLDTPFSPCISRDGKTIVLIVDSDKPKRASRVANEKAEK